MGTPLQCAEVSPAVAPAVAQVQAVCSAAFPTYSVHENIASIELRAKNGYIHRFRVDDRNIPFLRWCWPFEVSTGGKRKKIIRRVGNKHVCFTRCGLHTGGTTCRVIKASAVPRNAATKTGWIGPRTISISPRLTKNLRADVRITCRVG